MKFLRTKQDITDSYSAQTKDYKEQVLANSNESELEQQNNISFLIGKMKTDGNFSKEAFENIFEKELIKYTHGKFGKQDTVEMFERIDDIANQYTNYDIDLETANAKIFCEECGINTNEFNANTSKGFYALAILKSENIDIDQFKEMGANQLDTLYDGTTGNRSSVSFNGAFKLSMLKDMADKEGEVEIELNSGDIVSVEKDKNGYNYFLNGEYQHLSKKIENLLSSENISDNLRCSINEKTLDDIIATNSKGLKQDVTNALSDIVLNSFVNNIGK